MSERIPKIGFFPVSNTQTKQLSDGKLFAQSFPTSKNESYINAQSQNNQGSKAKKCDVKRGVISGLSSISNNLSGVSCTFFGIGSAELGRVTSNEPIALFGIKLIEAGLYKFDNADKNSEDSREAFSGCSK
jgi:hypothetical protein